MRSVSNSMGRLGVIDRLIWENDWPAGANQRIPGLPCWPTRICTFLGTSAMIPGVPNCQ